MTEAPSRLKIKSSQIKSFLQSPDEERACVLAALFNKIFPAYQINSLARVRMAIAQMAHESILFTDYEENLNFSAQGLANTWPLRFAINPNAKYKVPNAKAKQIARQPKIIANEVYGARMGNNGINDGWDLRGSGAIQLTGKDNITAYTRHKGFGNVYDTARLMRESDEYAIDSGCWFLSIYKGLLPEMDREHIEHCTIGINGALIGIEDRKALYERAKKDITTI